MLCNMPITIFAIFLKQLSFTRRNTPRQATWSILDRHLLIHIYKVYTSYIKVYNAFRVINRVTTTQTVYVCVFVR